MSTVSLQVGMVLTQGVPRMGPPSRDVRGRQELPWDPGGAGRIELVTLFLLSMFCLFLLPSYFHFRSIENPF